MSTSNGQRDFGTASRSSPSLAALPVFATANPENLALLDQKTTTRHVRRGTVLVHQHDAPDNLYLVTSGRFFVIPPGKQEAIAEVGPGEPIGELAFLAGVSRTANVVAARDSEVLVLSRDAYAEVTRRFPDILVSILTAVAKRLARVTGASPALKRHPPQTVALFPIGESGRLPEGFADRLTEAMKPKVAVTVSPETFGNLVETSDIEQLHDRLATLENSVDLILFALESAETPFARVCLGLADHLVLIAQTTVAGGSATQVSDRERSTTDLFLKSHRSLVLTRQRADQSTKGTAAWLADRDVSLHHHVALEDPGDMEKLGRFLTGKARGLVMGGGAALGCAHLGVAKALYESGTAIDFFGGTSVGAAMGGALAMGLSPDRVMDLTDDMFVADRAMHRVTLPLFSLLDHRVMDHHLSKNLHGLDIEDLPFNYFAVSANLTTNAMHVHRRGVAWEAVRASAAIPGVLPPFITKSGDVLVDGGIVDNLPISVMHDLKSGPNVVVSLRRQTPWRVRARYEETPTRRTMARDLLSARRKQYPSMATVLIRGLTMASERQRQLPRNEDDLVVLPPGTEAVGLLDWHKGRKLFELAFRDMAERLDKAGGLDALISAGEALEDTQAG